jgi:hypothetical protein
MDKEFTYEGFTFNIRVNLNIKIERRINGKRWHRITINDMGPGNYYEIKDIEDSQLEETINMMESDAKLYVDSFIRNSDPIFERLKNLGFK